MRWLLLIALAACGGEKKSAPAKHEDAGVRVTGEADRDKLFLSVPTVKAVEGIVERLSAKPHDAAKEIMRTLGRMGWKLGTQQYDVYLPHPTRQSITIRGDKPIEIASDLAYAASGKASGRIGEGDDVNGKIALVPYGDQLPGAQVAAAERARPRVSVSTAAGRPA